MVDQRADVYALGAILYELLSGQRPHPGDSQNAILHHIATQPAVPLDSVQGEPRLAAELVDVIGQTLASDPGASYDDDVQVRAEEIARISHKIKTVLSRSDGFSVYGSESGRRSRPQL